MLSRLESDSPKYSSKPIPVSLARAKTKPR